MPRASAVYFLAFCSVVVGLFGFWLINRYFLAGEDATWQRIQQTGIWRVGMDPSFPPFELLDGAGRPIGYDVGLAQAIAARWGVQVQIVAIGFDGLTDALLAGKVDSVVSALPYDPRLTEDLSYSRSYFEAGVRLAVGEDSTIRGVDALAGKRLVQCGVNICGVPIALAGSVTRRCPVNDCRRSRTGGEQELLRYLRRAVLPRATHPDAYSVEVNFAGIVQELWSLSGEGRRSRPIKRHHQQTDAY
ncbi:MAG: transporter substrate-binding domain-containing protein [Chloroflexi bacterium]|nr:transporter substrate-binding domain-containing protein [Chloroflexota bacterium]